MQRKLFFVAISVLVLNGFLFVLLYDIALAKNTVDEVRVPSILMIVAIVEGIAALVIADQQLTAKASGKTSRSERHRNVRESRKKDEWPQPYSAYRKQLMAGKITTALPEPENKEVVTRTEYDVF